MKKGSSPAKGRFRLSSANAPSSGRSWISWGHAPPDSVSVPDCEDLTIRSLIVLIIVIAALLGLRASQEQSTQARSSGIIEGREVRLGSRVGGRIHAVHADEGDTVVAGQVLVELEPYDLEARLAQARSQLAEARAGLERFQKGFRPEEIAQVRAAFEQVRALHDEAVAGPRKQEIQAASDALELALAELALAEVTHERVRELNIKKASTQADLDKAISQLAVARNSVDARRSNLDLLVEGTRPERIRQARARMDEAAAVLALHEAGFRSEEVAQSLARTEAASSALQVIQTQLKELQVRSPRDGIVEARDVEPGDMVAPNAPIVTVRDVRRLWLRTYVPQIWLARLGPGAKKAIRVDGMPGRTFEGTVSFVSSSAEFTPSNVQTPDQRSREVFQVRFELSPDPLLRPGMTADVVLEEGDSSNSGS